MKILFYQQRYMRAVLRLGEQDFKSLRSTLNSLGSEYLDKGSLTELFLIRFIRPPKEGEDLMFLAQTDRILSSEEAEATSISSKESADFIDVLTVTIPNRFGESLLDIIMNENYKSDQIDIWAWGDWRRNWRATCHTFYHNALFIHNQLSLLDKVTGLHEGEPGTPSTEYSDKSPEITENDRAMNEEQAVHLSSTESSHSRTLAKLLPKTFSEQYGGFNLARLWYLLVNSYEELWKLREAGTSDVAFICTNILNAVQEICCALLANEALPDPPLKHCQELLGIYNKELSTGRRSSLKNVDLKTDYETIKNEYLNPPQNLMQWFTHGLKLLGP